MKTFFTSKTQYGQRTDTPSAKAKPPVLREERKSLDKLRKWAGDWLPTDNELTDTISSDKRGKVAKWEYDVMLDTYGRMLDSKAKRVAETE